MTIDLVITHDCPLKLVMPIDLRIKPILPETTEEDVKQLISPYGKVKEILVNIRLKFAVVCFHTDQEATQVFETLSKTTLILKGQNVAVSLTGVGSNDQKKNAPEDPKKLARDFFKTLATKTVAWKINPLLSVGPLDFGMSRKRVEEILKTPLESEINDGPNRFTHFLELNHLENWTVFRVESKINYAIGADLQRMKAYSTGSGLLLGSIQFAFDAKDNLNAVIFYSSHFFPALGDQTILGLSNFELHDKFALNFENVQKPNNFLSLENGFCVSTSNIFRSILGYDQGPEVLVFSQKFADQFTLKSSDAISYLRFDGMLDDLKNLIDNVQDLPQRLDHRGRSLLHVIQLGKNFDLKMISYLIEKGFKPHLKDKDGATVLHYSQSAEAVKHFIKMGADVNAIDNKGWSPLHFAVKNGYTEIAELYIKAGAHINAKDMTGKTPWDVRSRGIHIEDLLFSSGAQSGIDKTHRSQVHEPDIEWFWDFFIDGTHVVEKERLIALKNSLTKLKPLELANFKEHLNHFAEVLLNQRNAAGFASVLDAYDEGYRDFVFWIISKGNAFYEISVKNPDKHYKALLDFSDFKESKLVEIFDHVCAHVTGSQQLPEILVRFSAIKKEDINWDFGDACEKFPKLNDYREGHE